MLVGIILILNCSAVSSQSYQTLWKSGSLLIALQSIERAIEAEGSDVSPEMNRDYARLLFAVGQVDRAIEVAEPLAQSYRSLTDRVLLAEYYRYRGRTDDFEQVLDQSLRIGRMMMQYGLDAEDWIAVGRLMALERADPARILSHYKRLLDARPDNSEAMIATAEVALATRSYDVAARHFHNALEIDPSAQPALAGLARAFVASGDPRAEEALSRLAALNPKHPDLFLIDAERHLDVGDTESALSSLNNILEVNSNHLDALSLKAAAHFLEDDGDALNVTQQRILSFNPTASQAYRIPGRIASRHYRFKQGKSFQQQALDVDPEDNDARLLLAMNHLRLAEDDAARPILEQVFESDPYNVQAYNLLGVSDALKAFDRIEDETFRLQMPRDEAAVMSTEVRALLDEAADRYAAEYDLELTKPVVVQMFDDHDEFIVRSVGLPGSAGHLGICFGTLITMDSPRARPPGSTNWKQILWHEFVHVITLQKTNNRMPRWLSEGISVYEETAQDASWGVKLDPQYKAVIDASGWPTTATLERYFTRPESQDELMFGYFAAGEFISAFVEAYGHAVLVDVLDRIGKGERTIPALEAASAADLKTINAHFDTHVRERCAALDNVKLDEHMEAYKLDAAILDAVAEGDALAKSGDLTSAEARYLEAHRLYPDYQGKAAPLRRIAALWADSDSLDHRVRTMTQLASWDRMAFDACLMLARISPDSATRSWALDRAFAVNPFSIELLTLRFEQARSADAFVPSMVELNRLIHLDHAHQREHRLARAELLAQHGDRQSARSEVLSLLEETPHDWPAQKLLLRLAETSP